MTRRRAALFVAFAIALGVLTRKVPLGVWLWDKSLGDVLYAVMVFGFAALVRPRAPAWTLGAVAFAVCCAVEAFQLTNVPKTLPFVLRRAIGDTFSWHDVACYAIGSALAALTSRALSASCSRRAHRPSRPS